MTRTHRVSMTGALIVCLIGTQLSTPLFASNEESSSGSASATQPAFRAEPHFTYTDEAFRLNPRAGVPALKISPSLVSMASVEPNDFAQRYQRYRGGRGGGRNRAQHEEIVLGALASIAGGALLVYSNRPECSSTDHMASGCSYGTKVAGGAVLTAGVFSLLLGALSWR